MGHLTFTVEFTLDGGLDHNAAALYEYGMRDFANSPWTEVDPFISGGTVLTDAWANGHGWDFSGSTATVDTSADLDDVAQVCTSDAICEWMKIISFTNDGVVPAVVGFDRKIPISLDYSRATSSSNNRDSIYLTWAFVDDRSVSPAALIHATDSSTVIASVADATNAAVFEGATGIDPGQLVMTYGGPAEVSQITNANLLLTVTVPGAGPQPTLALAYDSDPASVSTITFTKSDAYKYELLPADLFMQAQVVDIGNSLFIMKDPLDINFTIGPAISASFDYVKHFDQAEDFNALIANDDFPATVTSYSAAETASLLAWNQNGGYFTIAEDVTNSVSYIMAPTIAELNVPVDISTYPLDFEFELQNFSNANADVGDAILLRFADSTDGHYMAMGLQEDATGTKCVIFERDFDTDHLVDAAGGKLDCSNQANVIFRLLKDANGLYPAVSFDGGTQWNSLDSNNVNVTEYYAALPINLSPAPSSKLDVSFIVYSDATNTDMTAQLMSKTLINLTKMGYLAQMQAAGAGK
jgi:hypothetical protein